MKIKGNLSIWIIAIIVVAAAGITILACKDRIDNPTLREVNRNNKDTMKMMVPIINKNGKIADAPECLPVNNVIQLVLENTIKTNAEIAIMAVYSDDGTILAHFKPERIGKNMFDVDVEFSDCMQEMYKAMKSRKIYNGFKYDPLLNDNIRFIVKPLEIGYFDHNLSLLIGVHESFHKPI